MKTTSNQLLNNFLDKQHSHLWNRWDLELLQLEMCEWKFSTSSAFLILFFDTKTKKSFLRLSRSTKIKLKKKQKILAIVQIPPIRNWTLTNLKNELEFCENEEQAIKKIKDFAEKKGLFVIL